MRASKMLHFMLPSYVTLHPSLIFCSLPIYINIFVGPESSPPSPLYLFPTPRVQSHPIAWDLSSDDGSTASSIQSDGNGPSHAFRYTDNATRRAQQVLQHKLNMMSPTDKHMLAEAKANPGPIKIVATYPDSPMQKFQNPDSPMQKFQQDLNLSVAAMFEAEVQPFSALEELPTSQAHVTWQENKETRSVLCKATHIEAGRDEERSPQQGHKDRCNRLFRTIRSSHRK